MQLLDFSSHRLQASGGILELRVQRPSVLLASGTLPVPGAANVPGGYSGTRASHKSASAGEGYPRDEPYQRCIAHSTSQGPQHPQNQQHICQPLHAPLHTYCPSVSLDLSQRTTTSSHTLPVMCMLYTLWLGSV